MKDDRIENGMVLSDKPVNIVEFEGMKTIKCPFDCQEPDKIQCRKNSQYHLIVSMDARGIGHVHGPIADTKTMLAILKLIMEKTIENIK